MRTRSPFLPGNTEYSNALEENKIIVQSISIVVARLPLRRSEASLPSVHIFCSSPAEIAKRFRFEASVRSTGRREHRFIGALCRYAATGSVNDYGQTANHQDYDGAHYESADL
jgi:hypothetical protein